MGCVRGPHSCHVSRVDRWDLELTVPPRICAEDSSEARPWGLSSLLPDRVAGRSEDDEPSFPQGWAHTCHLSSPRRDTEAESWGTCTRDRLALRAGPHPLCLSPLAIDAPGKGIPWACSGLSSDGGGGATQEAPGPEGRNLPIARQTAEAARGPRRRKAPPWRTDVPHSRTAPV